VIEFTPWPKTPRFFHGSMTVTEKIDGTNAAIGIDCVEDFIMRPHPDFNRITTEVTNMDGIFRVWCQSRKRIITPQSDNFGFAEWVRLNSATLVRDLGPGLHFGEWWGKGIQRGYGQHRKRFSLFNTSRFEHCDFSTPDVDAVPVLSVGRVDTEEVLHCMWQLERYGSHAVPGFMNPEGVCIYLSDVGRSLKVTFDGDAPKWQAAA
jgi:RNA ligase